MGRIPETGGIPLRDLPHDGPPLTDHLIGGVGLTDHLQDGLHLTDILNTKQHPDEQVHLQDGLPPVILLPGAPCLNGLRRGDLPMTDMRKKEGCLKDLLGGDLLVKRCLPRKRRQRDVRG